MWAQKSKKFTWNKKHFDICVCETKKTYQKLEKICDFWNQKLKTFTKNQKNLPKTKKLCDLCVCKIKNQNNFLTLKTWNQKSLP